MRRGPRGGPAQFDVRLGRAEQLLAQANGSARGPLAVLAAVLRHQQHRAAATSAAPSTKPAGAQAAAEADAARYPLLDLDRVTGVVVEEVTRAVGALRPDVPEPLAEAGGRLRDLQPSELAAVVETWLEDPDLVDARLGFWLQVAAAPPLELGARDTVLPKGWIGAACPACGGRPQASVIAEESGQFMAGSPRSLVCGRCASWWPFPRVTCAGCGEDDSRAIASFLVEQQAYARVDSCSTCRSYVKTFDLRQPGGVDVVPLVDDVATLTLDVWAQQRGFSRPALSLAGV